MSPLKLNSLLTGIFLAMLFAIGDSATAQDGLRLWKPYSPETFGGARHQNDGVYGSVSGIYWSFSAPNGGYIGATTAKGVDERRWVYDGNKTYAQTNSVKIGMMDATTTLGTRFEIGNRRGHHGWLVSGYGLPRQSHTMSVNNMTMAIRDEGNITLQLSAVSNLAPVSYMWDRSSNSLFSPTAQEGNEHYPYGPHQSLEGKTTVNGIGYLWGVHGKVGEGLGTAYQISVAADTEGFLVLPGGRIDLSAIRPIPVGQMYAAAELVDSVVDAVLVPLPVWFKNSDIAVSTTNRSAELMYTYRAHPFSWGSMELLAGVRYWDFDDEFRFFGSGPGSRVAANEGGENVGDNNNNGEVTDPSLGGAEGNNYDYDFGTISILADMTINARGLNRVFGPQFGMKLHRQNARWTFGAEGRFTAGINAQSVKTEGYIATNYDYSSNYAYVTGTNTVLWMPTGLQFNNTNFGHKENKTYFSPILELRLSADWQWTNSVSFFGAFDTMYAGNIARGVRVTDYAVHSDGTIFGIRGNDRNDNVMVYGIEAGIKVKR